MCEFFCCHPPQLPFGKGTMLFVGFDYSQLSEPWVKTLIAGLEFAGTKADETLA